MASVSDYVQLMKLRIDSLLLLVAAAGYIATSGVAVDVWRFGLLMLAGLLGAAGASATNHYLDRDLDSVMHRTRTRPLPQHRIEPPAHALEFGVGLLILSLAIAGLGINLLTALMIGLGYAVYIGVYTVGLKRTHVSNIVIRGFAGSRPAPAPSAPPAESLRPHREVHCPSEPGDRLGRLQVLWDLPRPRPLWNDGRCPPPDSPLTFVCRDTTFSFNIAPTLASPILAGSRS